MPQFPSTCMHQWTPTTDMKALVASATIKMVVQVCFCHNDFISF